MAFQYGWAEQTPATRNTLARAPGARVVTRVKRRRKRSLAKAAKRVTRRRVARASKRGGKFVKGSAAAKRHMAKLRKLATKARRR